MTGDGSLAVRAVSVSFGAVHALKDVTATFPDAGISGLIGPNGAGKTTLLNVISGFQVQGAGSVRLGARDLSTEGIRARVVSGIVRTFQTVRLLETETVRDNIVLGCERLGGHGIVQQILGSAKGRGARRRDADLVDRTAAVLRLDGILDRTPSELPYAQRRLVEVARAVVGRPRVLLLDEPMAGMDKDARLALLESLRALHREVGMTMVVVEHDIEMVRRLCEHAVVLAGGEVVAEGPPGAVVQDPRVQAAYFGGGRASS